MNIQSALLDVMEEVFGIEKDELQQDIDLDLFENDLVDSLGIVTMMGELEEVLNKKLDISKMSPDDFRSVRTMTAAVEAQLK